MLTVAAVQRAFSEAVRLLEQVRENRLMERDREHRARNKTAHNGHQTPCALHGREMERELREKRDARKVEIKEAEAALRKLVLGKRADAVTGEMVSSVEDRVSGVGEVTRSVYEIGSGRN